MKSKKRKDGNIGKAACLARNFYTKNISLEMSSDGDVPKVVYEPSASILTSEGLYNTIKVVDVAKDQEVNCTAKFDDKTITYESTLSEEAEEQGTVKVCNTTDTSVQDTKVEKANMLSMAVLGLRVLLAKSIAFNTLMSIKLFLF
ncbi:TRDC protein, partial [Arenaria interpres]|nr:TRDC protein [Arenaria interpres]